MTNIGTKIKKIRELKNLSQDYLSSQLNMSQANYSRIERNEIKVKPETLEEIAKILEVDTETLTNFDEKVVFNVMNNHAASHVTYSGTINVYSIDSKIEKLYEDKIGLLEEKVHLLLEELKKYKNQ